MDSSEALRRAHQSQAVETSWKQSTSAQSVLFIYLFMGYLTMLSAMGNFIICTHPQISLGKPNQSK
jgi:hypothetical protein